MNLRKLKIKDSAENKTLLAVQEAIENSPNPMQEDAEDVGGFVEAYEVEAGRIVIEEGFGFMTDELEQQLGDILEADGYSFLDSYSKHDSNYNIWVK